VKATEWVEDDLAALCGIASGKVNLMGEDAADSWIHARNTSSPLDVLEND